VSDGQPTPVPGGGQVGAGRTDDPMSADRRVLTVAVVSMVLLVLVGVVSAQLFTGSACGSIDPRPHPDRAAGTALADVVADGLPDLDEEGQQALAASVGTAAARLGPVVGAADVRGAERLAIVDGGVAALGAVTTVLTEDAAEVRITQDLDEGTIVGDGDVLYSLALVNPLTGQVDAIQPLDGDLEPGTCIDTATVGTPLAFHLDAGGGELLLLRTEEDGDEPAIELRDAEAGSVWSTPAEVGVAPAGVLAERVDGALGDDVVVVGRRIAEGEDGAALLALDRVDGTERWSVGTDALADSVPAGDGPVWVTVLVVGDELALVALARDDERAAANVVAVSVDDGSLRWEADLDGPVEPLDAALSTGAEPVAWIAAREDDEVAFLRLAGDGERQAAGRFPGEDAAAVVTAEADSGYFGSGSSLMISDPEAQHAVTVDDAEILDLATDGELVHVLYGTDEGALVVSFAITPRSR
jgi:hypothetical protein